MSETLQGNMAEIKLNTTVLVVGGGYTGLSAAGQISRAGYPVILIDAGAELGTDNKSRSMQGLEDEGRKRLNQLVGDVTGNSAVTALTGITLTGAMGVPGDFTVRLGSAKGEIEKKVGAMVLATDFSVRCLNEKYQLNLSDRILSLTQMENLIADGKGLENKTVAFLAGFAKESNPVVMERIFRAVLDLEAFKGATPYIFVGNLKVAAEGLERIYLKSRDQGATYFKLNQMPAVSPDGKTLSFTDPVTRKAMELDADLIVIDEETTADQMNAELADMLKIHEGPGNFLQTDNVHRFPVKSNREGIFVIAGARDIQTMTTALMDVENVVLEIKGLLGDGKILVPENKAVLDIGKCTFCITCYRCCPHGAIYWDDKNKPVISPVACQGCGICAGECPMDAIQIGDYSDAEMMEKIKNGAPRSGPRIVAFCCRNSAYEAGLMADAFSQKAPSNLQMIKVPCAGKVDLDYIMNAFVEGADGVLVMACHAGNCKSEKGNTYAGWRVEDAHRILEEIGLQKDRLRFVTLASNMGTGFLTAVTDMERYLSEIY